MDRILFWLACASVLLLLLAVGVAWLEYRSHTGRVAKLRAQAEDSRLAAAEESSVPQPAHEKAHLLSASRTRADAVKANRASAALPSLLAQPMVASLPGAQHSPTNQAAKPATGERTQPSDASARSSIIESALARSGLGVPASVLASRAELAAMEQAPTWEDTQPMVLETTPIEFAPTQMEPHAFEFEPTRPVDFSTH